MKVFIGLFLTISLTSILAGPPALILTKLIKKNLTDQARKLSAVDPSLFLNRTSYSGFLTVDQKYNSNIFFWYIEAENHRPDTPWIMWLQGGPGATSLAGLFDEIGPFEYVDSKLKARKWSWAKDHSLLFIDNPVGTGFSFTDSPQGFIQDMDTCSSHLYSALRQFLMVFPELRKAPFYIAGESYAGRYIPTLGIKIMEQDLNIGRLDINLQGVILGNPVTSRESVGDYSAMYYQWGLVDSQGMLAVKPLQDAYNKALHNEESESALLLRQELLNKLNEISMQEQTFNILHDKITHLFDFTEFLNRPNVRQALHVGSIDFNQYNRTVHDKLAPDFLSEIRTKIEMLLDRYRMLIYCGQMDLTAPCVPNAKARRRHWHWQYREQFLNASRKPWWFDNKVAGYVKSGGGFTEVLVRGAGHLVPMDKPAQTTELISYFIRGLDLKLPPNYQVLPQDTPPYINDEPEGIPKTVYHLPYPEGHSTSETKVTMIISLILNVMLVCSIVCGVVYAMKWKRRNDAYMYNTMEDNNLVSTMF